MMKLIFRSKIHFMICLGSLTPAICSGISAPGAPAAPTVSAPTPPSTTTPSTSTTPSAPSVKQPPPKPVAPPVNNLTPEFRKSESYYRQSEEAPPSHSAYDSQEILALIEDQLTAIHANNILKAYTNFTANKFQESTSLDEFKYFVESFPVFSNNKNALFGNIDYKKEVAAIQGTLTATTGETLRVEYDFVKEGPQWKIIGIKLLKPQLPK
jgi:Domain of unknown function (DUF4864)